MQRTAVCLISGSTKVYLRGKNVYILNFHTDVLLSVKGKCQAATDINKFMVLLNKKEAVHVQ